MLSSVYKSKYGNYLIIAILSGLVFCFVYGKQIINPTYVDWCMVGGDLSQHYLGWVAYRNASWHFPIGLIDTLAYPDYTSVIFTDSIPLFAIFFKILSPILPESFQYFGLWGLMCFVFQGLFSARIFNYYTNNRFTVIGGSLLIVASPEIFYRLYGHDALAGQWIIVFALSLIFMYKRYSDDKKRLYSTVAIIAVLCCAIHMYFLLMCGIVVFAFCIEDIVYTKKVRRSILILIIYCMSALITIWLLGGFASTGSAYETIGLGYYNMNLNSLWNPMGTSSILQNLSVLTDGQGEGYGYVGFGVIVLMMMMIAEFVSVDKADVCMKLRKKNGMICGMICIFVLILIVSIQNVVSFGTHKLYELALPNIVKKAWSIFRASGRTIMVIDYMIIMLCVIIFVTMNKMHCKRAGIVIFLVLGIQIYDIHNWIATKHIDGGITYQSNICTDDIWNSVLDNNEIKHVVITYWIGDEAYYDIGEWALKHKLTMSSFAMVHATQDTIQEKALQFLQKPAADEIFIFNRDDESALHDANYKLNYYYAGDYIIGYSKKLAGGKKIDIH